MSRILFRPAAAAELDEAYRWYEARRSGLGDEFLAAVLVPKILTTSIPEILATPA